MNNNLDHNPFESLRGATMSKSEKKSLRANVRGFVAMHRPRHWYGWFTHHVLATLVLVLVLSGGGVLVAADSAKPDSALYTIRTSVNDKVRVSVAGDELDQLEKELELLGDYFEEEEMLIARELDF